MKYFISLILLVVVVWIVAIKVVAVDGPLGISGGSTVQNYAIPASSLPAGVLTNVWAGGVQIGGTAPPTAGFNVSNSTAAAGVSIGTNGTINASGAFSSGGTITANNQLICSFLQIDNGFASMDSFGDGSIYLVNSGFSGLTSLRFGPSLGWPQFDFSLTGPAISYNGIFKSTNGLASYARNLLAPVAITIGASPFNWTNSSASAGGGTNNLVVYVDGISVTGSLAQNGTTVFGTIGQNTLILQPGEYFTLTFTLGSPTATFKPF